MSQLRLASHIHTEWSDDCDWPLEKIAATLRRLGFHGALVCDHDRTMTEDRRQRLVEQCAQITSRGFLMVPGIEYQDPDHVVHIPVFGDIPFLGKSRPVIDTIRDAHEAGGAAIFAHPSRADAFNSFSPEWLPYLSGIEVWNRKYDGIRPNKWAVATARHHGLGQFVALDFHGPRQLYPLALVVEAEVVQSGWNQVIAALRDGRFNAKAFGASTNRFSSGPLNTALNSAEEFRKFLAPRIRKLESRYRQRS